MADYLDPYDGVSCDKQMTEEEERELNKRYVMAFALLDDDDDGTVTRNQLKHALKTTLGLEPTSEEFKNVLREMKADENGDIRLEGFLSAMKKSRDIQIENHGTLFDALDADGDGRVGNGDWQKIIYKFGIDLTEDEVEEVMKSTNPEISSSDSDIVFEDYDDRSSSAEENEDLETANRWKNKSNDAAGTR